MKKLLLIGGGGHCASVADVILQSDEYETVGIIDTNMEADLFGCIPFLGTDDDLPRLFSEDYKFAFITLGSIDSSSKRERLYKMVHDIGFTIPNIIDPSSVVSTYTVLGSGIFIGKGVVINSRVTIENGSIINTSAVVEHDCQIGAFVHVAPSATICGNVMIGCGSHIGAGAIIKQGTIIGDHTTIGMGSVVTKDIPAGIIAYGNPCKEMGKR